MPNLTNRQIISDVINDLRAVDLDDKVSKRYILNKLRGYAALFIKRDAELRRLFGLAELWIEVPCVELCEAPIVDCCDVDIPGCTTVMRSVKEIPKTYQTMYREMLQVFNVQYAKEFRQITPQEYKNIIVREFQDPRIVYFWLQNKRLIIPNSLVTIVTLRGVFLNPSDAKKLNSCSEDDKCASVLDEPFICPDYLVAVVKQETLKDLFSFYKRSVVDEEPNLNTNFKKDERQ